MNPSLAASLFTKPGALLSAFVSLSLITTSANATTSAAATPEQIKAALESAPTCDRFVRFDPEFVFNGMKAMNRSGVRVTAIRDSSQAFVIETNARAIDVVRSGQTLWVLTPVGLEEWALETKTRTHIHPTAMDGQASPYSAEQPTAMALFGERLVIAQGRLGFSVFDIQKKQLVHEAKFAVNRPREESMATGVTIIKDRAYFVLDNLTQPIDEFKPPFRGIVVVDLRDYSVVGKMDGLDPGADSITSDGKKVFVSFMGMPIWKYNVTQLQGAQLPQPEERIWQFPMRGSPTGHASIDSKFYYTCYIKSGEGPGRPKARIPAALLRSEVRMN